MHFIPQHEMAAKLAKSWAFLSGIELNFVESHSHMVEYNNTAVTIVLPIVIDTVPLPEALAIGLVIAESESKRIAAHMFGIEIDAVSTVDINDASKEACNILGSGLLKDEHVSIGIPYEVDTASFMALKASSSFSVTYTSDGPHKDLINLVIIKTETH